MPTRCAPLGVDGAFREGSLTKGGEIARKRVPPGTTSPVVIGTSCALARFLLMGGWSQGEAIDERVGVMSTLTKLC